MTEGIIVMYCSASAKKFFEAVVPFKRRDFVIFLDADDDDTEAFASKVQLVVHYGNFLSYMLVMNQIVCRMQKSPCGWVARRLTVLKKPLTWTWL